MQLSSKWQSFSMTSQPCWLLIHISVPRKTLTPSTRSSSIPFITPAPNTHRGCGCSCASTCGCGCDQKGAGPPPIQLPLCPKSASICPPATILVTIPWHSTTTLIALWSWDCLPNSSLLTCADPCDGPTPWNVTCDCLEFVNSKSICKLKRNSVHTLSSARCPIWAGPWSTPLPIWADLPSCSLGPLLLTWFNFNPSMDR